jgi:hypothetical protein
MVYLHHHWCYERVAATFCCLATAVLFGLMLLAAFEVLGLVGGANAQVIVEGANSTFPYVFEYLAERLGGSKTRMVEENSVHYIPRIEAPVPTDFIHGLQSAYAAASRTITYYTSAPSSVHIVTGLFQFVFSPLVLLLLQGFCLLAAFVQVYRWFKFRGDLSATIKEIDIHSRWIAAHPADSVLPVDVVAYRADLKVHDDQLRTNRDARDGLIVVHFPLYFLIFAGLFAWMGTYLPLLALGYLCVRMQWIALLCFSVLYKTIAYAFSFFAREHAFRYEDLATQSKSMPENMLTRTRTSSDPAPRLTNNFIRDYLFGGKLVAESAKVGSTVPLPVPKPIELPPPGLGHESVQVPRVEEVESLEYQKNEGNRGKSKGKAVGRGIQRGTTKAKRKDKYKPRDNAGDLTADQLKSLHAFWDTDPTARLLEVALIEAEEDLDKTVTATNRQDLIDYSELQLYRAQERMQDYMDDLVDRLYTNESLSGTVSVGGAPPSEKKIKRPVQTVEELTQESHSAHPWIAYPQGTVALIDVKIAAAESELLTLDGPEKGYVESVLYRMQKRRAVLVEEASIPPQASSSALPVKREGGALVLHQGVFTNLLKQAAASDQPSLAHHAGYQAQVFLNGTAVAHIFALSGRICGNRHVFDQPRDQWGARTYDGVPITSIYYQLTKSGAKFEIPLDYKLLIFPSDTEDDHGEHTDFCCLDTQATSLKSIDKSDLVVPESGMRVYITDLMHDYTSGNGIEDIVGYVYNEDLLQWTYGCNCEGGTCGCLVRSAGKVLGFHIGSLGHKNVFQQIPADSAFFPAISRHRIGGVAIAIKPSNPAVAPATSVAGPTESGSSSAKRFAVQRATKK